MAENKPAKRRGRPPKSAKTTVKENPGEPKDDEAPVKKRGRPPKYTEEQRQAVEKQRREDYQAAKQAENLAKASATVSNPEQGVFEKPQIKDYEEEAKKFEKPATDKVVQPQNSEEIVVYPFGRTTRSVAVKMGQLLEDIYRLSYTNTEKLKVVDLEKLKANTSLKPRAFDILWSSLKTVKNFIEQVSSTEYRLLEADLSKAKEIVLTERKVNG